MRFIYNYYTSDYHELLHKSKLPSLKIRRLRAKALETVKIVYKQCPLYLHDLHDLICIKNLLYSFRYTNTTEMPKVRTKVCS